MDFVSVSGLGTGNKCITEPTQDYMFLTRRKSLSGKSMADSVEDTQTDTRTYMCHGRLFPGRSVTSRVRFECIGQALNVDPVLHFSRFYRPPLLHLLFIALRKFTHTSNNTTTTKALHAMIGAHLATP